MRAVSSRSTRCHGTSGAPTTEQARKGGERSRGEGGERSSHARIGMRGPLIPMRAWLDRAGHLSGLEAGGADVEPFGRAADDGTDGLDVWVPAAAGAAVRM